MIGGFSGMGGARGGFVVCGRFEIQNDALVKRFENIPGLTVIQEENSHLIAGS